ncbi:hypothetical protein CKAN_02012700 [Cinnamomum micranthum f. kanehirae]|uniref:HAT C-terminal dimerisation domain-containing protein n=1 Tax=Cinnamomum micranthum f. kanehirae TaxID=337451 RepID=A0A3S3NF29_9MAGN|nr:hypothetical protein CKAN_02012700 [Cinnamomum micranthum f. kanehirae]
MLEDMSKAHLFPVNASTIETARKITKSIYNHLSVLNLMRREYTNGRELIQPAITRFATNFISLQCLFKYRKELRQMFTSTAWVESNASSTPAGIEITEIILNNTFWKDVEHILKVSEALVVVLRLADSEEKPAMGYVYEAMDRANEVIQKRFKNKDYELYWKIIDCRWENQLHSALHAATYYLNPSFVFSPTFSKHSEVMRDSRFGFGSTAAIRNREKMSPDKWWDRFGNGIHELKKLAIRIFSQCISASGCVRNWSIFKHIHSPKRNRLVHQRLNDLVLVHYNLKLRERDMLKRTGNAASDPISLENINILVG